MIIRLEFPPNYEQITDVFPAVRRMKPVFAFGSVIFNPHGVEIGRGCYLHECVHGERQKAIGVENWWAKYLASPEFRLAEEIPGHVAQYQHDTAGMTRNQRRIHLRWIAQSLASPLYGNLVTVHEAKRLISRETDFS